MCLTPNGLLPSEPSVCIADNRAIALPAHLATLPTLHVLEVKIWFSYEPIWPPSLKTHFLSPYPAASFLPYASCIVPTILQSEYHKYPVYVWKVSIIINPAALQKMAVYRIVFP